jgi:hypothetical protein
MDVRLGPLWVAARADRADDLALVDGRADADPYRSQVHERDGITVGGADRQALALARDRAREEDDPGRRRAHVGPRRRGDVDPAMLAAPVRILAPDERPQHRPVHGPAPGRSQGSKREQREEADHNYVAHSDNHAARLATGPAVVKSAYKDAR